MSATKSTPTTERATYQIRALDRGLDILEAFSLAEPELSVAQIAERTGLPKPTVIRLISVLADRGYVERVADAERYRLGVKTLEVSAVYLQSTSLEAEARPIMAELARTTGQTANLGILDRGQVVHIEVMAPDRPVRFWASIGKREDAYVSGLGKALLAALPPEELGAYLDQDFPAVTPFTITEADRLREDLNEVVRQGFAVDREESNVGVVCLAAPIRSAAGEIVAAISISGLKVEFEAGDTMTRYAKDVRAAADEISMRLGWSGRQG
jgi:DNA-binding IclR family transcriptional regulator